MIPDLKFDQTNAARSMGYLCGSLKEIPGFASIQEVDTVLERDRRVSETIARRFTGLISD